MYLDRLMKQTATYWPLHGTTPYDQYGDAAFAAAAPVALDPATDTGVRWENRSEKFIKETGDEDFSRALVWSVTTAFAVGDYLCLGVSVASNPETVTGVGRIKRVEKIWDTKAQHYLIKATI